MPKPNNTGANDSKPIGQTFRAMLNAALEDSRRQKIQIDLLNSYLEQISANLQTNLELECRDFFNQAARCPEKERNPFIIEAVTVIDLQSGETLYSPVKKIGFPLFNKIFRLCDQRYFAVAGLHRLHEDLRDMDIAMVRTVGLVKDENGPVSGLPGIILDVSVSYIDGALENAAYYPNLPPKVQKFDKRGGGGFSFKND